VPTQESPEKDIEMNLFCFASRDEENIRRGIEARKWAVASVSDWAMRTRIGKARKYLKVGSLGLLSCSVSGILCARGFGAGGSEGKAGHQPSVERSASRFAIAGYCI
jgi:hypothetical protein